MQRERPALQLLESLRSIAALPLEKIEALELRGFAWRMRDSLVDAPDMPSFKEDVETAICWHSSKVRLLLVAAVAAGKATAIANPNIAKAFIIGGLHITRYSRLPRISSCAFD